MDFRCGATNDTRLFWSCQHGGECVVDAVLGEHCINCDAGYSHDIYGYAHFYNCALPNWAPVTFCALEGCILLIGLIGIARLYWQGAVIRGVTKRLLWLSIVCSVVAWFAVLSSVIQEGMFEGALVLLMILGALGFCLSPTLVPVLLRPVASMTGNEIMLRRMTVMSWTLSIIQVFFHACAVAAGIYYCRDANPRVYNLIVVIALGAVSLVLIIQSTCTFLVALRLFRLFTLFSNEETIATSTPTGNVKPNGSLVSRRRYQITSQLKIIGVFCFIIMIGSISLTCPLVLWIVYGSLPYMSIFFYVAFTTIALCFPVIIPFIKLNQPAKLTLSGGVGWKPGSTYEKHVVSEGADEEASELPTPTMLRGLGLVNKKRKNAVLQKMLMRVLSKISEESQHGASVVMSHMTAPREQTAENPLEQREESEQKTNG